MLRVGDLDASLRFYTEQLGMKLLRRSDYPEGKFTLAFVGYGDEKRPHRPRAHPQLGPRATYALGDAFGHLAIGVDDIYAHLRAAARRGRPDHPRARPDEARHAR